MSQVQLKMASSYVPPEKLWQLHLRSNEALKARLEGVVRLWRAIAESRGQDASKIDIAHVVRSILDTRIDEGFAEFGGEPKNEAAWTAVESSIKSAKSKP